MPCCHEFMFYWQRNKEIAGNQPSLSEVVMCYKVTKNPELVNTEPVLPGETEIRNQQGSGHNLFINEYITNDF